MHGFEKIGVSIKTFTLSFFVVVVNFIPGWAQTASQRNQIIRHYDLPSLQSSSSPHLLNIQNQRNQISHYSNLKQLPLEIRNREGSLSRFARIDEKGNFIYLKPYSNVEAAHTIGVDQLYPAGNLGISLTGKDMIIGLWDAGRVRGQHELLSGKVAQEDDPEEYDDHSTQVAGTLVGKELTTSVGAAARGMAYEGSLKAYDWDDDIEEMYDAASNGLLISNHSYGPDLEQVRSPLNLIGDYDQVSAAVDNLTYTAPYYLIVNAAGNDRDLYKKYNPDDDGYNLLAGEMSTAKNTLVVSAVYQVPHYEGPESVQMSEFSSWGPTLDNRIKPDISADGMFILSSVATTLGGRLANNQYDYYSGTSAAAPSVAGGLLLLQELSSQLNKGEFLKAATLKAIVASTAKPAGNFPGPDPQFGWGLLDVAQAAQLLLDNDTEETSFYDELTLRDQVPYALSIKASRDGIVKATIAWSDPAGNVERIKDGGPALVNDLDIRVTGTKGKKYYPWRLNPQRFSGPALNDGDNAVDNIEQIQIPEVKKGDEFLLEISHKGQLKDGIQDFSLVVSGAIREKIADLESHLFIVYPNPGSGVLYIDFDSAYDNYELRIFDLLGRMFKNKQYRGKPTAHDAIDVSNLASGNYYLQIRTNEGTTTRQIIIK